MIPIQNKQAIKFAFLCRIQNFMEVNAPSTQVVTYQPHSIQMKLLLKCY